MNVRCPECATVFRIDPEKVPRGGVRARCSICGAVIEVGVSAAPSVSAPRVVPPAGGTPIAGTGAVRPTSGLRPTGYFVAPVADAPAVEGGTPPRATAAPFADPVVDPPPRALAPRPSTGRHVNPYLANDPNAKGKRLARALVSDMIVYQPHLRDEGLRQGTLKELFRDEIKKSYEEYVAQVGRDFAESTTHFQAALNDILAGGHRLF